MQLTDRVLNRTLWARQQLVPALRDARSADPVAMTRCLLGLQAQDNLPPYLGLSARLDGFDPRRLSAAIEQRHVVRILSMRGTVHALSVADALILRPWVQGALDRVSATVPASRPARDVPTHVLLAATQDALRAGPLRLDDLTEHLRRDFPEVEPAALRAAARNRLPLVQVPPRGLWRRSGGVVYELLTTWVGAEHREVDLPELVRRYLRAYGPATAADMSKWSGVSRLGPVFAELAGELVEHTDERGRRLYDVADGVLADADTELPVLLLGTYDNLWLSHADRSRIATDDNRARWTGSNGGLGAGVFVDGMLEGYWNRTADDIVVTPFRVFSRREQTGLDAEIARIRAFLAVGD